MKDGFEDDGCALGRIETVRDAQRKRYDALAQIRAQDPARAKYDYSEGRMKRTDAHVVCACMQANVPFLHEQGA